MPAKPLVAIACGGTGGHLFPGLAVAEALQERGCEIVLLISPKEIDQVAVKSARGMEVFTLPAFGLSRGQALKSLLGLFRSFRASQELFRMRTPQAVLAMGGFTSVAPVLAGKLRGAYTFLHESNTVPGKANRWLAHLVDHAFTGFPSTRIRLSAQKVMNTGTPVRPQFEPSDPVSARTALGLAPRRPVLLVMGGSQGAAGINELVLQALPALSAAMPELQYLHLTGEKEFNKVQGGYAIQKSAAVVRPFLTEMELAMAAATLAISRAGASSLAELAAMRLPSILIPYPAATDNHQYYNALAVADAGGAWLLQQRETTAKIFAETILKLLQDPAALGRMKEELVRWHSPRAAQEMADKMMLFVRTQAFDFPNESSARREKTSQPMDKVQPPSLVA